METLTNSAAEATNEATTEVADLKRRLSWAIDHGVIGCEADSGALLEKLDQCQTVEEVESWRRTARRWQYAVEAAEPWLSTADLLEMTRN